MFTVSDIVKDIDRGILANNMVEDKFSYRIIFYINENGKGTKHYLDAPYVTGKYYQEKSFRDQQHCDSGNDGSQKWKMYPLIEQGVFIQLRRVFQADKWRT